MSAEGKNRPRKWELSKKNKKSEIKSKLIQNFLLSKDKFFPRRFFSEAEEEHNQYVFKPRIGRDLYVRKGYTKSRGLQASKTAGY